MRINVTQCPRQYPHKKSAPSRALFFFIHSRKMVNNFVRFEGKTYAVFDGGAGQTKKLKETKAKSCKTCSGDECLYITGIYEITYSVTTTVTSPERNNSKNLLLIQFIR
jgi:hypothetical protein